MLDIEPVLRSLFASPVSVIYVVDHSADIMPCLKRELDEYLGRVLTGEAVLRERVREGLRVEYIAHENNGYGGGHNVALRRADALPGDGGGGDYHLVVNPDVWFGPRVIPALAAYMREHADVAQMMPRVLYPNGDPQPLAKLLPTPFDMFGRLCMPRFLIARRNARFELSAHQEEVMDVPFLSGCFMFLRLSAAKEIGFFDERFFMYAEDIDLTRRLHEHYRTVYYPLLPIYHRFSRASRRSLRLFVIHVCNVARYFNKWGWLRDEARDTTNRRLLSSLNDTR